MPSTVYKIMATLAFSPQIQLMVLGFLALAGGGSSQRSTMIQNGCTAYDCRRTCMNGQISENPGDNGFRFDIDGEVKNTYVPEKTYKG